MSSHSINTRSNSSDPTTKSYFNSPKIKKLSPGSGLVHLSSSSSSSSQSSNEIKAKFSTLLSSYPLKLLTPKLLPSQPLNLGILYTLSYGGGLVSGDLISLKIEIDKGCGLVLLTQGSTKIFKKRRSKKLYNYNNTNKEDQNDNKEEEEDITKQRMFINLNSNSFLLLLPDSISPFKFSKYSQIQRFKLSSDNSSSLLILDWINSGRGGGGGGNDKNEEIWEMDFYNSINEIFLGNKIIMREKMLLDNSNSNSKIKQEEGLSKIANSLKPYNVYGTVLFTGPHLIKLMNLLKVRSDEFRQFQIKQPQDLIWSFSEINSEFGAGIIRVAAKEIESARDWLRETFTQGGVGDLVGEAIWPRCI
ncbi:uncharacterized protein I206_104715 [Kwoniella pini CBS 10737]|uniref:Urease accessory protein n=1 Tax=Kwoniella pini CBS 10737 TaxID=1296096 RepID=A0A1B9I7T2_9TREE|nr:uncharacterized protein I206_02253 [Kwoniella pini CBS 10737]OCF51539.1 hypothetical protein I206_02253 [Kwoniella pini CBS 10737]